MGSKHYCIYDSDPDSLPSAKSAHLQMIVPRPSEQSVALLQETHSKCVRHNRLPEKHRIPIICAHLALGYSRTTLGLSLRLRSRPQALDALPDTSGSDLCALESLDHCDSKNANSAGSWFNSAKAAVASYSAGANEESQTRTKAHMCTMPQVRQRE